MAKTMWCETFNFARSLRCLQRQGLKCFERILLMFLILRLVDFFCKTGSELVNYSIREAIFDPVSKGSVDVWQCLHFSGRSLYLRPFHWRLGWLASCFRCFRCNLNFNRNLFYSSPLYEVHVGTLTPTWCAKQSDYEILWNVKVSKQESGKLQKCLCTDTFPDWAIDIYWYLHLCVRQLSDSCPVDLSHSKLSRYRNPSRRCSSRTCLRSGFCRSRRALRMSHIESSIR